MTVSVKEEPVEAAEPKISLRSSKLSARVWLTVVGAGLLTWAIITYGRLLAEIVIVVFGGVLINLAIRPLADRLRKYKIPPSLTVLAVYVFFIGAVYLLVQLTIPAITRELGSLQDGGTDIAEMLATRLENIPPLRQLNVSIETILENVAAQAQNAMGMIVAALAELTHIAVDVLLILVLGYFFVTDRKIGTGLLFTWVPRHRRWRVRTIAGNTSRRLSRWLVAQIALASIFGLLYGTGLALMGVPFAVSIAVIGTVLEFVPFLGGAVSLTLSIIVALTFRPQMTIWVIVLYFAIQQLQVNVLQPVLYGRAVDVHPAIILLALLIGAQLGGVIGALFAVPVAVVVLTVLDEIEKPGEAPPPPEAQLPASRLPE